ncbi:MAG: hypothetical protein WD377_02640 [Nitriliruptoraceae bacterium]
MKTEATHLTLEHIAQEARPYPTYLLENARTGLCLFSAAFMGWNEAIHFALEDVRTTCVDVDAKKLEAMSELYPESWRFICRDAWEFAEHRAALGDKWDVVSVDTFRGNATERSLVSLDLWCSLANDAVIATLELGQTYEVPEGWTASEFQRNSEVFWLVLTR